MGAVSRRHEIDDDRTAALCLKLGLKDESPWPVAPPCAELRRSRRNEPAPVLGRPEQGGKARGRVETGPAQPVDRAVPPDQGSRPAVADQRIVFDAKRHGRCTPMITLAWAQHIIASALGSFQSRSVQSPGGMISVHP